MIVMKKLKEIKKILKDSPVDTLFMVGFCLVLLAVIVFSGYFMFSII